MQFMSAARIRMSLIVLVLAALTGCVGGERQVDVIVLAEGKNEPAGIFEGGRALGLVRLGPGGGLVTLEASSPHTLTVRSEGRPDKAVTFTPRTSGERVALYVVQCVIFPPLLLMLPQRIASGAFNDFEPDRATVRWESE